MTDAVTRSHCSLPIRGLGHLIVVLFLLYPPYCLEDEERELLIDGVLRSSTLAPTAGCGGIDPCTPGICERLSTPSDESYACIMLRRSITLKTVVGVT
jgi:hypothetical protein